MTEGGIYLFLGPDRYRKLERVKALEQELAIHPLDRHEASASQLSATTLVALAREHPAASPVRLILVDEAHRLSGACLKVLEEQAELFMTTACLILLADADIDANHPLASLKAICSVEQFAWLTPHEVSRWIARYVVTRKKRIAEAAIQDLLGVYGADLAGIRSVLDQLISWSGSRLNLSQADLRVFLQVPTTSAFGGKSSFALVDAIAHRDVAAALQAMQDQLRAGKEVLELLGLVVWQLQRWLTVGRLAEAGLSRERIATLTGLRPWQFERMQRELAGRSMGSLRRALHRCWQLDVAAKSGRVPNPRAALEQVVVDLCRPAGTVAA